MKSFYVELSGFSKHEIAGAANKSFHFTELICAEPNIYGFMMTILVEQEEESRLKSELKENSIHNISTLPHEIYSSKKTHFSFEPHPSIHVLPGHKLFVQLVPLAYLREYKSKLLCTIVQDKLL
jgi:hypothetical protein